MAERRQITTSGIQEVGGNINVTPHLINTDATTTADKLYIGRADTGAATSAALWRIIRYDVSGDLTTDGFASGSTEFDQVWDDRASLTYS